MSELLTTDERPSEPEILRATARRLAQLHTLDCTERDEHCWWCLKPWPCPDSVWSERVLRTSGRLQAL
jgi:hypothetical protein